MTPEGVLCLDKPTGPTSHDLVARARRLLGQPRIGHAGTLDPPATGVLVLLLGKDRLLRFLDDEPKRHGNLPPGDHHLDGRRRRRPHRGAPGSPPEPETVRQAAGAAVGTGSQVPPVVSARKVEGVRAYRLARRGIPVHPRATEITVFSFSVSPGAAAADWAFGPWSREGPHVRALIRDLGSALGCGASVTALRGSVPAPSVCQRRP